MAEGTRQRGCGLVGKTLTLHVSYPGSSPGTSSRPFIYFEEYLLDASQTLAPT